MLQVGLHSKTWKQCTYALPRQSLGGWRRAQQSHLLYGRFVTKGGRLYIALQLPSAGGLAVAASTCSLAVGPHEGGCRQELWRSEMLCVCTPARTRLIADTSLMSFCRYQLQSHSRVMAQGKV